MKWADHVHFYPTTSILKDVPVPSIKKKNPVYTSQLKAGDPTNLFMHKAGGGIKA